MKTWTCFGALFIHLLLKGIPFISLGSQSEFILGSYIFFHTWLEISPLLKK